MALQDPVAVYYARTNQEANLLCHVLNQAGVEAHVMEDVPMAFPWGGASPINWPKVWVDKPNEAEAARILREYEQTRYDHEPERAQGVGDETLIQATCEECGQPSLFSPRIVGSVQECPLCGKFMDVDPAGEEEDWGEPEGEGSEESAEGDS